MKESYYYWKRILYGFFKDILKYTLIMSLLGFLIVFVVQSWRFNPLAYIICFMICFGINLFLFMRKKEVKNEFKNNQ